VLRGEDNDWVKKCMEYEVKVPGQEVDQRKHGERLWKKTVVCKACRLNRKDAMDRSRWRKQIGIIDDHDECEWVNVSSGNSSPGLSQKKSKEP